MTSHVKNLEKMKLCNLNYLERISPGNPNFVIQIIRMFLKNAPHSIEEIKSSLLTSDWNNIHHHAHKLGSDITCMGIPKNYRNIARQIEEYAKLKENLDLIPGLLKQLEKAIQIACKELDEELNKN